MPNWDSVLKEISTVQATKGESAFDKVRKKYLGRLFSHTGRNIIAYYSGFLTKRIDGIEINDEDKNGFMLCIHEMDRLKGLDLILHTPGGDAAPSQRLRGLVLAVVVLVFLDLASGDLGDLNGVANDVGGALLALGAFRHGDAYPSDRGAWA